MSKYDAAQLSSVPGRPSFESSGFNSVAVIPLMTSKSKSNNGKFEPNPNHSERSFEYFMSSLSLFAKSKSATTVDSSASNLSDNKSNSSSIDSNFRSTRSMMSVDTSNSNQHDGEINTNTKEASSIHEAKGNDDKYKWKEELNEILLVIPNANLTRPGDWRYDKTPLSCFDWSKGCQRIHFFDGRPDKSRMAHDRIVNPNIVEDWGDLLPSRSTTAVLGVLNCKDCIDTESLLLAQEELRQWAKIYRHTPYELKAQVDPKSNSVNGSASNDVSNYLLKHRMFVFDSFDERCQSELDFTATTLGTDLIAFPPTEGGHHTNMINQHLNVVVNDLAVSVFRNNEHVINQLDDLAKNSGHFFKFNFPSMISSSSSNTTHTIVERSSSHNDNNSTSSSHSSSPEKTKTNKLFTIKAAMDRALSASTRTGFNSNSSSNHNHQQNQQQYTAIPNFLFTPLDDLPYDFSNLTQKDLEAIKKQQLGRREKMAGDYCLLAGSPLDAYERYSHAMEMAKASHDPLWYAASVEGCAIAYIAMADAGGHSVDEYLDGHFKLPEEVLALAATSNPNNPEIQKRNAIDKTKTTLPAAILALAEEALGIYCRHPKLAPLYVELLLKLASYTANKEESHLHCQWGVGEGCYGGDKSSDGQNRWENSLMTHLSLGALGSKGKEYSLIRSLARCRGCADLLQRAVIAGAIDPRTRADVAVTSARICLVGVLASHWGDYNNSTSPRLKLPRKAAFFTTIAAESMTRCAMIDSQQQLRATNLWLAASHLYARDGNGVAGNGNYGWATLRASALDGLSQMNNHIASEQAAELLILLLSEISPDQCETSKLLTSIEEESIIQADSIHGIAESGSKHGDSTATIDINRSEVSSENKDFSNMAPPKLTTQASIRGTKTTITTKNNFFAQISPSTFLITQSRWLENEPIPDISLPILDMREMLSTIETGNESQLASLDASGQPLRSPIISLNCIVPRVKYETCANSQTRYIANLVDFRTRMPTLSYQNNGNFSIYGSSKAKDKHLSSIVPPPIHIISTSIIKSESNLLLERTKAAGYSEKVASASMATFFNPYDNKRKDEEKKPNQITLVAEGEERIVVVVFSNLLSIPLEVPSCHLEFSGGTNKIEASPLSFTVPAKCKKFSVRFPFNILPTRVLNVLESTNDNDVFQSHHFELIGLCITCMNRPYFIAFENKDKSDTITKDGLIYRQLPEAASVYKLGPHAKKSKKEEASVKIESVPAQPNLLVSFTTSLTPMDDHATVPVHLSDGEIYTIPPFRLENNFGSSGLGKMERLQIICVGLPGLQDEILFDTDKEAAARGEDVFLDSESDVGSTDEFQELMEDDGLPPLKMKATTEGLSLKSINERSKSHEGSVVTFQIAATHDMGNSLANGGHVRIRFRYRGPSPNPATEIWRRREISLRILRVKGPR